MNQTREYRSPRTTPEETGVTYFNVGVVTDRGKELIKKRNRES